MNANEVVDEVKPYEDFFSSSDLKSCWVLEGDARTITRVCR